MINFKSTLSILLINLLIFCFNYKAIGQNIDLDFKEETGVLTADPAVTTQTYDFSSSRKSLVARLHFHRVETKN